MANPIFDEFLDPATWYTPGVGARYQQLYRHLKEAISYGKLNPEMQLPSERDMAKQTEVSRVTIRKAIARLAAEGYLEQRPGAGSFVKSPTDQRLQQNLSSLVSFTESMRLRGYSSSSKVLSAGLHPPTPSEILALGLSGDTLVARITRLRIAEPGALAIETSSVPASVLPNPKMVSVSLYAVLRRSGMAPVRAIQRIAAVKLNEKEADLLEVPVGSAFLKIERTGYLASGRPVEFTTGVYRSDIYDFIAEVRINEAT